jgi:UDP-3-O-[3-hydroxymyristoyl] N-acetylglucosamine deacetylase
MNLLQQTLKKEVIFSGMGLFTGRDAVVKLCPAPLDSGIVFKRVDIPGAPEVPAKLEYLKEATRCTMLEKESASIQTVEHLLAAIRAAEIDNLLIEISGPEIPIYDGSANYFSQMIREAGVLSQDGEKKVAQLSEPVSWSSGEIHLVALPSNEFRVSYTLHYPQSPYLRSQFFSIALDCKKFEQEIAPCRTFTLYEDVAPLIEKGILKGGGLENGVVIKGTEVMNPEGVRFPDEMVRHKVLDLIGDLTLIGMPFLAHIIAIRSGHAAHHAFARQLVNHMRRV